MLEKNIYVHDLAMLRLKNENISALSNEQLMEKYLATVSELNSADEKFRKEHRSEYGGVKIGW